MAVLGALLDTAPEGGALLRRLDISGPRPWRPPPDARQLAALTQRLTRLEHLTMHGLFLGVNGVRLMVRALQGMPGMRVVHMQSNVRTRAEAKVLEPLLTTLTHIPHIVRGALPHYECQLPVSAARGCANWRQVFQIWCCITIVRSSYINLN